MKRKKVTLLLTIAIVIACIGYGIYNYYAPPIERKPFIIEKKNDDTIRVAYLGDSWAFFHREHECKIPIIMEETLHHPIVVHSYGICGLTSKEFYEQIFKNRDLKFFMQKRKYDYCFVSLGINDTYKKMSTTYYQQSMKYILKFLLSNQIHPIIMEIPDYDINKSFDRQSISKKSLRLLSMFINNTPLDCRQYFRQALDATLKEDGIKNNVSILRYLSWNGNGDKNMNTLYNKDGLHLNERGYAKLDSCIAKICIKLYKNSQYGKN